MKLEESDQPQECEKSPEESAKPAESVNNPEQPTKDAKGTKDIKDAKDAKISLCPQKKDLKFFIFVCVSCASFVMIGFYTFLSKDEKITKLFTNQPILTNDIINGTINDKTNATTDDIDYGCLYWSILGHSV